jgi:transposase
MPSTFSVHEVAERYDVSEHAVLGWVARGELRAINVARSPEAKKPRWRITQQALEAFEQARTRSPPPPRARRRKQPADVIEFY